jgi:hypothetical protein
MCELIVSVGLNQALKGRAGPEARDFVESFVSELMSGTTALVAGLASIGDHAIKAEAVRQVIEDRSSEIRTNGGRTLKEYLRIFCT